MGSNNGNTQIVSSGDWERRKEIANFADKDVKLLKEVAPIAKKYAG